MDGGLFGLLMGFGMFVFPIAGTLILITECRVGFVGPNAAPLGSR
jgi:hypothetical protein